MSLDRVQETLLHLLIMLSLPSSASNASNVVDKMNKIMDNARRELPKYQVSLRHLHCEP